MEEQPPRERNKRRDAVVSGFAGVGAATGALALLNLFAPGAPLPPFQLGQAFVQAAPGDLATYFIDTLGHLALPLAVISISVAFLLTGALLGLLIPALERILVGRTVAACSLSLLPLWIAWLVLAPSAARSAHIGGYATSAIVGILVSSLVAASVRARLKTSPRLEGSLDRSRRYFVRAAAAGAGGIILGASGIGRIIRPGADTGGTRLALPTLQPVESPSLSPGDAAYDKIEGLTPELTAVPDFYTVDEAFVDPSIDPVTWRLKITGAVHEGRSISYEELKSMPAVERYQTLECISNPVGGDLISTTRWTGVPLREILNRAGVGQGAVEVVFRSADGYSESLPLEKAMDESTLVAIGMDGNALPRAHGYPARLLSIGTYGMKNPKWLVGIEVVTEQYEGFWEQRGWDKSAVVKTGARIDVPTDGPASGATTLAGIAFAGDRGISRVQVSLDGGRSWNEARLETPLSGVTWRRWMFQGTPGPARAEALVRAWDGGGNVQTSIVTPPHPSGASGYDAVVLG